MLKCWQDDPLKRPKFSEIYDVLPEIKPEQLKTVVSNCEPKKDHLLYRQGDIITVLERSTSTSLWKGVLSSGKTGFFNPANTVAYLEALPSSNRYNTKIYKISEYMLSFNPLEILSVAQMNVVAKENLGLK